MFCSNVVVALDVVKKHGVIIGEIAKYLTLEDLFLLVPITDSVRALS